MTRLPERNLDVLRASAVLCVLVAHVSVAFNVPAISTMSGRAGVLAFFVHTACVLMGSLERQRVWQFYVRRFFRIYPLSVATVLAVLILHVPSGHGHLGQHYHYVARPTAVVLGNLSLLFMRPTAAILPPFWSLPVEVQMYVVLPLCFWFARRSLEWTIALYGLGLIVGLTGTLQGAFWMPFFVPCFLAGVMVYAFRRHARIPQLPAKWFWWLLPAALLGAIKESQGIWPNEHYRQWLTCACIAAGLIVIRELPESRATRIAAVIARYSYGIYLMHMLALWAGVQLSGPRWVQVLVIFVLLIALPWVAYHTIEKPGIDFGRRITSQPSKESEVTLPVPEPTGEESVVAS